MLTDMGEGTLPITLPATGNNLKILNWGHRLDNYYKPISALQVQIIDGIFIKLARMEIFSISEDEGISCSLFLNNGSFSAKTYKIKMSQLNWYKETFGTMNNNAENRITHWLNFIDLHTEKYVYAPTITNISAELFSLIFPPEATQLDSGKSYQSIYNDGLLILNSFNKDYYVFGGELAPIKKLQNPIASEIPLLATRRTKMFQQFKQNNKYLNTDYGYLTSPFLKLKYVLESLFAFFGYSFNYSDFTNYHISFDKIILLNNIADALYTNIFDESQLVTDLEIKEFKNEIEKVFAGKFIFNEFNKTCKFLFFSEVLDRQPDIDLTQYLTSKPKITINKQKKLVLSTPDGTSEDETEDKKDIEKVTIEFDFLKSATIQTVQNFRPDSNSTVNDLYTIDVQYDMLNIGDIINKNQLTADHTIGNRHWTELDLGDEKKLNKVMLGSYDELEMTGKRVGGTEENPTYTDWFKYKTTKRVFNDLAGSGTNLDVEKILYARYKDFIENSNIEIDCTMSIPKAVLNNLDLQTPKLLLGQKVLIDTIKTMLGGSRNFQEVKFRTLRTYHDRES